MHGAVFGKATPRRELIQALRLVSSQAWTGCIDVYVRGQKIGYVVVAAGRPVWALAVGQQQPLATLLREQGRLTRTQLAAIRERLARDADRPSLGRVLQESEVVSQVLLRRAMARHLRSALSTLLARTDVEVIFREGPRMSGQEFTFEWSGILPAIHEGRTPPQAPADRSDATGVHPVAPASGPQAATDLPADAAPPDGESEGFQPGPLGPGSLWDDPVLQQLLDPGGSRGRPATGAPHRPPARAVRALLERCLEIPGVSGLVVLGRAGQALDHAGRLPGDPARAVTAISRTFTAVEASLAELEAGTSRGLLIEWPAGLLLGLRTNGCWVVLVFESSAQPAEVQRIMQRLAEEVAPGP